MLRFESATVALASSSSVKREDTTRLKSPSPSHQETALSPRWWWEGRPLTITKKRRALIEAASSKLIVHVCSFYIILDVIGIIMCNTVLLLHRIVEATKEIICIHWPNCSISQGFGWIHNSNPHSSQWEPHLPASPWQQRRRTEHAHSR